MLAVPRDKDGMAPSQAEAQVSLMLGSAQGVGCGADASNETVCRSGIQGCYRGIPNLHLIQPPLISESRNSDAQTWVRKLR